jgi:hypothetical protein
MEVNKIIKKIRKIQRAIQMLFETAEFIVSVGIRMHFTH